ncbi:MAG: tetratricopeptide repeat protein [Planctomycetota bacterium]
MPMLSVAVCRWARFGGMVFLACAAGCGGLGRNDNAEGVRLYQQGNYLGAVTHFQQALHRQPGSPDCFYNLGATYHQQAKVFGRPEDVRTAEQYYNLCLSRAPDHPACNRGLAVLLVETGRSDRAVGLLDGWARRRPTDPDPQIELARLCQEHGDLREAETHLVDALAIAPGNPRALVALGQLREATGDTTLALANYSRALAADGGQPVVAARAAALSPAPPVTRVAALPPAGGFPPPQPSPPPQAWGPGGPLPFTGTPPAR